jgi:putative cardiolipin synthase
MAIPIEALAGSTPSATALDEYRGVLAANHASLVVTQLPYMATLESGAALDALITGKSSLLWATGEVIYDSPEKSKVNSGEQRGRLLRNRLGDVAAKVRTELIVVSPYLIPGPDGMKYFEGLRERGASVRILTNSLASSDVPVVHSGYQAFRVPLLELGVDLFEARPMPGKPMVRSGRLKSSSAGLYALHAKVYVFDRERVFVGSMNLDQRSLHINTEIGLLIESAELARQIALRVADMTQPANSYVMRLAEADGTGRRALVWHTLEDGKAVDYLEEPGVNAWQRFQVNLLSMLPIDELL